MSGFKLDSNGDIEVDNNGAMLLLSTYQELVKQRLQIKLRTFKGEWWLDTSFGIPYRDTGDGRAIIGKGYSKADIDSIYIAGIKADPDVLSIRYFNSVYDPVKRDYSLDFEVQSRDGNLSTTSYIAPWQEETYTYQTNLISSSCNIQFLDWALDLHPIVHTDAEGALAPPYAWREGGDFYVYSGYVDKNYVVNGNNLYLYPDYFTSGYMTGD